MSKDRNELTELEPGEGDEIELDAQGLYCPEPVMLLHNKMRDIADGQILRLKATDPSTTRDVPKFCVYLGHELMSQQEEGELFVYRIKKKVE